MYVTRSPLEVLMITYPNPLGWETWQSTSANPTPFTVTITNTSAPVFLYCSGEARRAETA